MKIGLNQTAADLYCVYLSWVNYGKVCAIYKVDPMSFDEYKELLG